jgi:mannose-6-phosphate isomerase-like protein (cupin superfamily)
MSESRHKFLVTQREDSEFSSGGLRNYLQYRDLGVREATGGDFLAHIIRPNGPCPEGGAGRHVHKLDFQMNYVLKGWVTMWIDGQGEVTIREGGCWVQPPAIKHDLVGYSDDAEWVEITAPAEFDTQLA